MGCGGTFKVVSIEIHNKEKKTYVVLGAPHTATSFVAKALQDQGVDMGVSMPELYQDGQFTLMNKWFLKKPGGRWNNPPSEEEIMEVDVDWRLEALMNKRNRQDMWGFKDPRTSLTLKRYLPYLEGDPYLICCFRKPDKVVDSFKSSKYTKKMDRKTVDEYNRRIIKGIKEFCEL